MLSPTPTDLMARACADLRVGLPVAVGGVLLASVETLGAARLDALRDQGDLILTLSGRRAETLKARAYDGDVARIAVPKDADLTWLRAVADPANDLRAPMKGPLPTLRGGDCTPWRTGIALAKAAQLLPAVVGTVAPAPDGITHLPAALPPIDMQVPDFVAAARVPLVVERQSRVQVFRDGSEEHYAIEIGLVDRARPVLTRLHSACFTGDVLGSLKCDCGPQLHAAMQAMADAGGGVLLYLDQEGRGIGLANKMRAYDLQDQGFDTVEANHRLGFEDDERDFRLGAGLLRRTGIGAVRLMTNNPRKIAMMQAQGIDVAERVPLHVGRTADNAAYLDVKRAKSGHLE
ncbi:GTP cyclohydrolase II [Jannaschia donghaensis]|uniref:GTP cyclohydrolase-2 n=1 Tax=Jannaschia donghaensis TaxID=420998 RepID=A0A0M6YK04_9RHOB|nr:GTP cyclohydrolase II [Jannaschia donghaensis]CTQ49386.1 GTP cyclohydrolase-2 [Jannaschia donghaensis]